MAYADVSLASTNVTNPVFGAATNFYFDSWVSGSAGSNDQSSRTDASATATAASGNATSASQTGAGASSTPAASAPGFLAGISPIALYIGGGAVLLLAAVWILRH